MATKECPSCAVDIQADHDICPLCGYEFPQQKPVIKWAAILLALLFTYPLIKLLISIFK